MVTLNEPDPRSGSKKPTRERILDAALAAFGAHGPMGARVDEIAASAGVNKRMLYHYFGNKDDLFQAVLEEIYDTICQAGQNLELNRHLAI